MGAVDTTYTFTATDTITSSKMNNIIDQTTITTDAIFGSTLEVVSGKLKVRSQGITSNELASNAVTSTQIASGSIDPSKLTAGYPSWTSSGNLTVNGSATALSSITANTASVSIGSARTASGSSSIDFNSAFPLSSYDARISRESGVDGNLVIENTGAGSIVFGNIPVGTVSGSAPIYGARAFAKINPLDPATASRSLAFKSGSYTRTTASTTIDVVGHNLKTNDKIRLNFTTGSGTDGLYTVTSAPSANQFVVNHTGTATSGAVTAQFVVIQGAKNISTASWYDTSNQRIVLNFQNPMIDVNYTTMVTAQHYPSAWGDVGCEDTLGTSQLNTINQCHVYTQNGSRFLNIVIFS